MYSRKILEFEPVVFQMVVKYLYRFFEAFEIVELKGEDKAEYKLWYFVGM